MFTNSAEFGIISQRDYFDKDIANSENIDGYYIVEPNDFVYNPRISTLAPFGPVRRNKLDKSGAMSPLYYVFRTHDVDCGYLEYFFKTNRWHSFMHLNGNSGARSDRFAIRDEVFRDMPISMPQDIEEQKKVGDFFSTLELAITLHQREYFSFDFGGGSAKNVQKTLSWEQRKVKDIADNTYGGGTPQTSIDSYWNGEIPWIQSQDIIENQLFNVEPRKHISEEAISKSATKLVPKNSIAIVTRVGVGKLAFMPFSYCTSQDFLSLSGIQIDEKYATYSIYQMLQKEKQNVQGTSIKGITIEEMLSKKIPVPCNSDEQGAIGAFFHNLDSLITLHQHKPNKKGHDVLTVMPFKGNQRKPHYLCT